MNKALLGYFDYAASTPLCEEAQEAMLEYSREFPGNPSAAHALGKQARQKWLELKEAFCELLGFSDGRLILTSGASEANNLVWQSFTKDREHRFLMASDVHDSIYSSTKMNEGQCQLIKLNDKGSLDLTQLKSEIKSEKTMFSYSHINNETGYVHDPHQIGQMCENRQCLTLVDGVQAIGQQRLTLDELPFNAYTFSAHKFGGPRGLGGMFVRDIKLCPQIVGGHQEYGLRAGTENLAALAGAYVALKKCLEKVNEENERLEQLRNQVLEWLHEKKVAFQCNTDMKHSSPHLLSLSFPGHNGHHLVHHLSQEGFMVSTGSACQADREEPSRLILALGKTHEAALGSLRLSFGKETKLDQVRDFLNCLLRYL